MNPSKIPLSKWSSGQLKLEVASLLNKPEYLIMYTHEMKLKGYPSTDDERRDFIKLQKGNTL